MSSEYDNNQPEQLLSTDVSTDDLKVETFPETSGTGTVTKFVRRAKGGHVFGDITIRYLNGGDTETDITASIYEGKDGDPMGKIAKRQYAELVSAIGVSNLNQIEGGRVKFVAGPQTGAKGDPTKPNYKKFLPPAE